MATLYPGDPAALLATLLLSVCLVSGAALAISMRLKRRHAARHAVLFAAVLCILLIPLIAGAFWATGTSILALPLLPVEPRWTDGDSVERSIRRDTDRSAPRVATDLAANGHKEIIGRSNASAASRSLPTPAAASFTTAGKTVGWHSAVAAVVLLWLTGSVGSLVLIALGAVRLSQIRRRAAVLCHERLGRTPEEIAKSLGSVEAPQILVSSSVPSPLACGVVRPTVILPSGLASRLSDDHLRDVLTHEFAHLVRRDPFALLLQRVGGSLFWPIPLVHWVNQRLSQAREDLCDNYVLAFRDPIDYSETLLRVAEISRPPRPMVGAVGILFWRGRLEQRVTRLIDERRNRMTHSSRLGGRLVLAAFLLASVFVCGVTIVAAQAEPEAERQRDASVETELQGAPSDEASPEKKSHRVFFQPRHGMKHKSSWTALSRFKSAKEKPHEQLFARLTLEGEIPVKRTNEAEPVFKIKLTAGSDDSLNIKLTRPGGAVYNRILQRDKPLAWKIQGKTYYIYYPTSEIAADKPAESPYAMIIVTCLPAEDPNAAKEQETFPPEKSTDDSQGDGGSDLLRNIRAATAPILAEMADKHGYGLQAGQSLRRVPTPFSPLRMVYYRVGNPTQYEAIPRPPTSMLFHWDKGRLQYRGMSLGSPPAEGRRLKYVLSAVTGIETHEMEGSDELLNQTVSGDWVVRPTAPTAKILAELEAILRKEASIAIRLELRAVERSVYVAHGRYRLAPLPGQKAHGTLHLTDKTITTDRVHIFGKAFVPNSGAGGGTGPFDEFLQRLGEWIGAPVVSEVNQGPTREISWHLHGRSPFTEKMRAEDHDAQLVLANITKQTNLKFRKEARPVKVLFVGP